MVDTKTKPNIGKLKKKLTPQQYNICFLKGTEPPFSGKYTDNFDKGMYHCVVCDTPLFYSDSKFHSDSGWPSFDRPVDVKNIKYEDEDSLGMHRTEILCNNCGAHLGHVFDDGPTATRKRYCTNSLALEFRSKNKMTDRDQDVQPKRKKWNNNYTTRLGVSTRVK